MVLRYLYMFLFLVLRYWEKYIIFMLMYGGLILLCILILLLLFLMLDYI